MTHLMRDVAPQNSCSTTTAARTEPRGTQTVIDTPLGVAAANDPGWPANDEGTSASNHAPKQLDANSSAPTRQVAGPAWNRAGWSGRSREGHRLPQHPLVGATTISAVRPPAMSASRSDDGLADLRVALSELERLRELGPRRLIPDWDSVCRRTTPCQPAWITTQQRPGRGARVVCERLPPDSSTSPWMRRRLSPHTMSWCACAMRWNGQLRSSISQFAPTLGW